jgi:uncharacterized membrane protein
MSATRSSALLLGTASLALLLVLQIVWHALLEPPPANRFWPTLLLAVAPLLPGLWTSLRNPRRGVLIGGIVCLFYFCHAVAVLYVNAGARWPPLAELALTLVVIGASGWDARKYKRPPRR